MLESLNDAVKRMLECCFENARIPSFKWRKQESCAEDATGTCKTVYKLSGNNTNGQHYSSTKSLSSLEDYLGLAISWYQLFSFCYTCLNSIPAYIFLSLFLIISVLSALALTRQEVWAGEVRGLVGWGELMDSASSWSLAHAFAYHGLSPCPALPCPGQPATELEVWRYERWQEPGPVMETARQLGSEML